MPTVKQMGLSDLPIFNLLQQKMTWLNDRQSVLSRNIANSSTPGYVPNDLKAQDFRNIMKGVQADMLRTNAMHMQGRPSEGGSSKVMVSPDSQSSPDGNAVVLEEQMMKVAETQMAYAEASGVYKKMIGMWRTALGSGR